MEIARIAVRNVRSYPDGELALGPGTTLLVGDVGAGKTSLLCAVEMALFGFAEFDASYLVRHGARDAEVELTLAQGEHTYTLNRRFRRRESKGRPTFQLDSSTYSEDGVTRRYSATELKQRVIELLGFPDNPNPRAHSDLWRWAVYVPQEAMREILAQDASKRLETVRKALGLEQYRIARENAQLVAAELGRRAERHSDRADELARSAGELERWTTEMETAERDLREAHAERPALLAALEATESEIVRVETLRQRESALVIDRTELSRRLDEGERASAAAAQRCERLEARRRDLAAAATRQPVLDDELAGIEGALSRARAARDAHRTEAERAQRDYRAFTAAQSDARALREALTRTRLDLARASEEEQLAARRVGELGAAPPMLDAIVAPPGTVVELKVALERAITAQSQENERRAVAESEQRELQTLQRDGVCPRCHQPVRADEFRRHLNEVEATVARAREGAEEAARTRAAIETDLAAWEAFERRRQVREHALGLLQSAQAEAARVRDRQGELARRARDGEGALAAAEALQAQWADAPDEAERLASSSRADEVEIRTLEGRRAPLTDERSRLVEQLAGRASLDLDEQGARDELARRQAEVVGFLARREEVDRLLGTIGREVARLPELVAARRRGDERRTELDQRVGRLGRAVEHARAARDVAASDAARRAQLLNEAAEERSVGDWFGGEFREGLATLEQRLLVRAQQEFQAGFSRYFRALVDDPALLARCDATFSPGVEIDGEWTPPEALSGGERTALALAYRLALGQVVHSFGELSLSTLILDEPTDGFSPEQVGRMGELLDELHLPQVVLVSHEPGLASVADRVVRVRKHDGVSIIEEDRSSGPRPPRAEGVRPTPPPDPARPRSRRRTVEETAR